MSTSESNHQKAVPFFARCLEGQIVEDLSETDMESVAGGKKSVTLKYPSDGEDGSGIATRKYPSGSDDGGMAVTLKYPSDGDDYIAL